MRAVTMNELEQIAGGLAVIHGRKSQADLVQLPPVTVTAPPLPPGGGPSAPGTGGVSGGGGSGGGSPPSSQWGDLTPETDTPAQRNALVEQAFDILYDLGYYAPPGTDVSYTDTYAFKNDITGELRYSQTYNPTSHESNIYGITNQYGDITITQNNMNSQATGLAVGMFRWNILENDAGDPSLSGQNLVTIRDGGLDYLQSTIATIAHEFFHANDVYQNGGTNPDKPAALETLEDNRAETQGFIAERAFSEAVIEDAQN